MDKVRKEDGMAQEAMLVNAALNSWNLLIGRSSKTFAALSDTELQREVAPGKNRIYYLLGHLTAVHDRLLPLLRLGEQLHPELDSKFIGSADRTFPADEPEASALRKAWSEVNEKLTEAFASLTPEEWLERHASVSEADFAQDPSRNRLAVLLSRTTHIAYHEGQIRLAR
jgi:hypothetical protein